MTELDPRLRPLDFVEEEKWRYRAASAMGDYEVHERIAERGWNWRTSRIISDPYPTRDEAIAAAQLDYAEKMVPWLSGARAPGYAEAVEDCARLCDAEAKTRFTNARKADGGDPSWGDPAAASLAQDHKAITAQQLAAAIRALAPKERGDA